MSKEECRRTTAGGVALLTCPFCGAKGKVQEQDAMPPEYPAPWWIAMCSHATPRHHKRGTGCPVCPMAYGDTAEDAARNWNTRAGKAAEKGGTDANRD